MLPPDPDAAVKLAVNRLGDDVAGLRPWTFIDQKGSGQDGGAFQNNQWLQRDLNTSVGNPDTADVQLANNQITLAEGAWAWDVEAPAYRCERPTSST